MPASDSRAVLRATKASQRAIWDWMRSVRNCLAQRWRNVQATAVARLGEHETVRRPAAAEPPPLPSGTDQAVAQAVPLRVNEVGLAVLPVWVAWKPNPLIDPPLALITELKPTLRAVI